MDLWTALFLLFTVGLFLLWRLLEHFKQTDALEGNRRTRSHNHAHVLAAIVLCEKAGLPPEFTTRLRQLLIQSTVGQAELEDVERDTIVRALLSHLREFECLKHVHVLFRKRTRTLYQDEYGQTVFDRWDAEKKYFLERVLSPATTERVRHVLGFDFPFSVRANEWLAAPLDTQSWDFDDWLDCPDEVLDKMEWDHESVDVDQPCVDFHETMSGEDYEAFVAGLVRVAGWTAHLTKRTGDHGADVIAEHDGRRVAIQCKRYDGTVGNQSVQEAFSAAQFYDCGMGFVVSNSEFTPAARQAAQKLGVGLLHHEDVTARFLDLLGDLPLAPDSQEVRRDTTSSATGQDPRDTPPDLPCPETQNNVSAPVANRRLVRPKSTRLPAQVNRLSQRVPPLPPYKGN